MPNFLCEIITHLQSVLVVYQATQRMTERPEVLLSRADYIEDIKVRWQIHHLLFDERNHRQTFKERVYTFLCRCKCYSPLKCLNSMKNTHIEHPEDSIRTEIWFLTWFSESDSTPGMVSAIVWGTDPGTGTFCCTKSVFNKVKSKSIIHMTKLTKPSR